MHATKRYLFYASTVAIYAVNTKSFAVEKVFNVSSKYASSFAVSPYGDNLMVTASTDGRLMVWNIEEVL